MIEPEDQDDLTDLPAFPIEGETVLVTVPLTESERENAQREARMLGRVLAFSRAQMMHSAMKDLGYTPEQALEFVKPDEDHTERIRERQAENLSWYDLDQVADSDLEAASRRWAEVREAARDELQTGARAARAMTLLGFEKPMDRARFLVLREEIARPWNPQGGIEWALIDQMAMAQTMMFYWQEILTGRMLEDMIPLGKDYAVYARRGWEAVRLNHVQAQEQAADMVERWQKAFQRSLRALRDMRRYSPAVTINNPGQVNIGQQQVNMNTKE